MCLKIQTENSESPLIWSIGEDFLLSPGADSFSGRLDGAGISHSIFSPAVLADSGRVTLTAALATLVVVLAVAVVTRVTAIADVSVTVVTACCSETILSAMVEVGGMFSGTEVGISVSDFGFSLFSDGSSSTSIGSG